jgi:hypothetical protein
VDPKKPVTGTPGSSSPKPSPEGDLGLNSTVDEFFTRLRSDMRHPSPSQESVEAAMQTMQRLAAEAAGEPTADPAARHFDLRDLRTPESPRQPVLWNVRPAPSRCFWRCS